MLNISGSNPINQLNDFVVFYSHWPGFINVQTSLFHIHGLGLGPEKASPEFKSREKTALLVT